MSRLKLATLMAALGMVFALQASAQPLEKELVIVDTGGAFQPGLAKNFSNPC